MVKASQFKVGGMQPLTMIDFPGRMATVLFAQGCNLRCRFCYNKTLLPDRAREMISWSSVINFLKDRQGFIEGVVFSGGEPCRQDAFLDALEQVRDLGFETALHTNGFYAEKVQTALNLRLLSFVAVDFKTSLSRYSEIGGEALPEDKFVGLLKSLVESGVKHEVRTTFHPQVVSEKEILEIADLLSELKIQKYVIQKFQHGEAFDASLPLLPNSELKQATLLKLRSRFADFALRGFNQNLDGETARKRA